VELTAIGIVESTLSDRSSAPKQGTEGGPDAWLAINDDAAAGLDGLGVGEIFVLTWLHQSDRSVLRVHPRDNPVNPERGVFSTRSADRPNPVGLHRARIVAIDEQRLRVDHLEAVDGTPVIDIKPVIPAEAGTA
jgi:tRNA-Thr(GGU) m(6)t(6)A37 methyltransferase TsaA